MNVSGILAALKAAGVRLHVIGGDKIALAAPIPPEPELIEAVKQHKPGVLALLLGSRDLFERPKSKPGVPVVRDERDHGPNRHLSAAARAAGVTCPRGDDERPRGPWRL